MKKNILLILLGILLPTMLPAQHIIQRPQKKQPVKTQPAKKPVKKSQPASDSAEQQLSPVLQRLISNMVLVEGGTFTMGHTEEQGIGGLRDEKPVHQVMLRSFLIGKYEVTQEEWEAVMGSNPSGFKGANRPVENVSWDDCQEFISKLNALTGKKFRLPTEAEWEYAARGGNRSKGYMYSGSDKADDVSWHKDNSGGETHEVGQKAPNELGLYDMSGNILEWCQDCYDSDYYNMSPTSNPTGPTSGSYRVLRGGDWKTASPGGCVSRRSFCPPETRRNFRGLRLAM